MSSIPSIPDTVTSGEKGGSQKMESSRSKYGVKHPSWPVATELILPFLALSIHLGEVLFSATLENYLKEGDGCGALSWLLYLEA